MKVGDLVKYCGLLKGEEELPTDTGIILSINEDGYYKVLWSDGNYDEDLIYSELEVISESR
tara:strand:- start:1438 stop:1620 length:183 start_codon:yes stop_codon:yes gene_type:complete